MPREPFQSSRFNTFSGGAYEWIGRISQKYRALTDLHPPQHVECELWSRNQVEFIRSALSLQGKTASPGFVDRSLGPQAGERADALSGLDAQIGDLILALEKVRSRALGPEPARNLDVEFLRSLNPKSSLRATEGGLGPEHLSLALEAACRWFNADSFRELNPVEQAALVFLRLLEIKPFETANERAALLAASLFTMRAGLPPVIFYAGFFDNYGRALEAGSGMNTAPMVELIARSVETTLDRMAADAKQMTSGG